MPLIAAANSMKTNPDGKAEASGTKRRDKRRRNAPWSVRPPDDIRRLTAILRERTGLSRNALICDALRRQYPELAREVMLEVLRDHRQLTFEELDSMEQALAGSSDEYLLERIAATRAVLNNRRGRRTDIRGKGDRSGKRDDR